MTILDASLKAGLRVHGGAVNYVTIANGKAGAVPWTLDHVAIKFAFRQRSSEMRARLGKGEYLRATPD